MNNAPQKSWPRLIMLAVLLLVGLVAITTYRSWPSADEIAARREKDEQENPRDKNGKLKRPPLPDFQTRIPVLLPGVLQKQVNREKLDPTGLNQDIVDRKLAESLNSAVRANRVKPGHWYTAYFPVVANHFNVDGDLESKAVLPNLGPLPIPGTDYQVTASRPVGLAKKEWKNLETSLYVPTRSDTTNRARSVNIAFSLNRNHSSIAQTATVQPIVAMRPFQYHFVVLSNRPDNWSFLKVTDSFQMQGQLGNGELMPAVYTLVPSRPGDPVPLSRNPLEWTTVAYVLWDNLPASELDTDQQDAMLDWLHHGGQLIVSGPDSLDELQSSFLADYLPARFDGSVPLSADDVTVLNANWSIPSKTTNTTRDLTIPITRSIQGVRFDPHAAAQFVAGTGEVAIERPIGRGRIVITAFSLSSRRVRAWRSFQSFLNGALLRKPARRFGKNRNLIDTFRLVDDQASIYDPLLGSTVRFISRDLGSAGSNATSSAFDFDNFDTAPTYSFGLSPLTNAVADPDVAVETSVSRGTRNRSDSWHYGGYQDQKQAGVGGWSDFSAVPIAARQSLKESAGIDPPSADFVMKMLGGYLLVLVPLNWLVFRLLGKVEWAWATAPLIAIGGAICVVRMASLDIGFVRSNSELGLLEIYADHPRAHYTQYSALYTSLSTRYSAELDNASAQALPFSSSVSKRRPKDATLSPVTLRQSASNRLENFQVQSNSTGMLHTESMLDLEGEISLDEQTLTNTTAVELQAAGVIRRTSQTQYEVAWIGDLAAGQSVTLNFEPVKAAERFQAWQRDARLSSLARRARAVWVANVQEERGFAPLQQILQFPELADQLPDYQSVMIRMDVQIEAREWSFSDFRQAYINVQGRLERQATDVNAGEMFDAITKHLTLSQGEVRLLGVTDQTLGLGTLEPAATQTRRQTLIVAHLGHPELPTARRDENARPDKSAQSNLDAEAEAKQIEATFDERVKE